MSKQLKFVVSVDVESGKLTKRMKEQIETFIQSAIDKNIDGADDEDFSVERVTDVKFLVPKKRKPKAELAVICHGGKVQGVRANFRAGVGVIDIDDMTETMSKDLAFAQMEKETKHLTHYLY